MPSTARSVTTTEEAGIPDQNVLVASPPSASVVHPTPGTPRHDTRADLIAQSARAYKDKALMPGRKSPTPLPSASASLQISPNHHWRAANVGVAKYSGIARQNDHGTSIGPGNQYRNTASEVPYGPSSPRSSMPSRQHTRRFTPTDPYSNLTSLQRDVLLCIQTAEEQNPSSSLYPTSAQKPTWKGVHIRDIVESLTNRHPGLVDRFSDLTSVTFQ
jgi:hypothetical protein